MLGVEVGRAGGRAGGDLVEGGEPIHYDTQPYSISEYIYIFFYYKRFVVVRCTVIIYSCFTCMRMFYVL